MYDEYGFPEDFTEFIGPDEAASAAKKSDDEGLPETASTPHVPMREQFPDAGSTYLGGKCDGWEYRTVFGGAKLAYTYEMLKQFLREEGYADVPLPETADDLKLFKRPRSGSQIEMFGERGYVHNPVKILFPRDKSLRNALILCVYNEKSPGHLLRFHGLSLA